MKLFLWQLFPRETLLVQSLSSSSNINSDHELGVCIHRALSHRPQAVYALAAPPPPANS
jgi:hypothetical protein